MSARPHPDVASKATERYASSSYCISVQLFIRSRRSSCFTETGDRTPSSEEADARPYTSLITPTYWPISNLSFISKLLERFAAVRFVGHSEGNSLFPVHQSSYRHGLSAETAILCVHNDIVSAVDSKRIVDLVLLDLSAAFDMVDHDTLLSVLQRRFGVCVSALSWIKSYLSDRTRNFLVNGVSSGPVAVNCRVPQGSVFGPINFISYTEDVSTVFHRHQIRYHLYADDKQTYPDLSVEDVSLARRVLQDCMLDAANWCSARRLQLNASKAQLIWFVSRFSLKKLTLDDLTLRLDSGSVHPVNVVRDFGVMLDCELSMKQHVTKVASSCFYHLRRLKQISRLVGKSHGTAGLSVHPFAPRLL